MKHSHWKQKKKKRFEGLDNENANQNNSAQSEGNAQQNDTDAQQTQITTTKSGPLIASRNGGIQYAIAISIFLLGVFLIVLAWAIPTMTTQTSIVFTVIGFLVLLLGMMHIIAIPTMFA